MAARRKKYTREFKLEALRLVDGSSHPVAEIARELGVTPAMLSRWRQQLAASAPPTTGAGSDGASLAEELTRLRRENAVLRQERDFLKKAAAFFAKESP
jgi:transposase